MTLKKGTVGLILYFGFLLLPRAVKTFFGRFVLGTLGEIVVIIVSGLLTEKAVDLIKKDEE